MKNKSNKKSFANEDQGVIFVLFCMALIPLIGVFALFFDGARVFTSKLQQEANAEYAAISALEEYTVKRDSGVYPLPEWFPKAIEKAEKSGGLNLYVASNRNGKEVNSGGLFSGEDGEIKFGMWSGGFIETNDISKIDSVMVILKNRTGKEMISYFATVAGFKSFTSVSSAIAYYDQVRAQDHVNPFVLIKQ